MMDEKKRKKMLDDESLDQVVGGRRMTVANQNANYISCRQGPGTNYPVEYRLYNGEPVCAVGKPVYNENDGYYWTQLDDGCWVAFGLLK